MKAFLIFFALVACTFFSCGESSNTGNDDNNGTDSTAGSVKETVDKQAEATVVLKDPKVFYYDYETQRGVEEALVMTEDAAVEEMQAITEADGNFFGLELSDGTIVQFMYDGTKSTWFLDIPNPVTQESYNADISRADVMKIISDVYDGKSAEVIKATYN